MLGGGGRRSRSDLLYAARPPQWSIFNFFNSLIFIYKIHIPNLFFIIPFQSPKMDSDDEYQRSWDEAYDALVEEVEQEVQEVEERWAAAVVPHPIQHRRTIPCDHIGANQRLMDDYFGENPNFPLELFRRRFRISQRLFLHIASSLAPRYRCFTLRSDVSGRIELSMIQKYTTAGQQVHGGPVDMFDENLHMGETTSL